MAASPSPLSKSQERIYSGQQLVQALRSGLAAVKQQLGVLSILDGTAASWPGINQAVDDMEFLVDMSAQTNNRLEKLVAKSEAAAENSMSEAATLKDSLAHANQKCEDLQKDNAELVKDNRALTNQLKTSNQECDQQRQELWTLEKQRADLVNELDKFRQDNQFMEGEISNLRSTAADQIKQLTALREELAARKSDCQHMKQSAADFKAQAVDLRQQLENTSGTLRAVQHQLEHVRGEKQHFEKESERLQQETTRLAAELAKMTELCHRQKDWAEVVKKVEADKLKDEQTKHTNSRFAFEQARSEFEQTITRLTTELNNKEQVALAKVAEVTAIAKQVNLLNIQLRDLQKQLAVMQADKATVIREREIAKMEIAKLQAKIQAAAMQVAQLDKDRLMAEGRAKEQAAADTARVQAAYENARKEGAVQKALAEGWARDLKEAQLRLRVEQDKQAALQKQLDTVLQNKDGGSQKHLEMVKNIATMEQVIRELKTQANNKELELRKVKAESASLQKQLEKKCENLQRECNESALEIQRLKNGEGTRLPPLVGRPQSLEEELDHLKRLVNHSVANKNGVERRPTSSTPQVRLPPTGIPPKQVTLVRPPTL